MSRFSVIDPENLGELQALELLDTDQTVSDRMVKLREVWADHDPPAEAEYDVQDLEFDPLKINQECNTFFEALVRDRVNQAVRSVTLAFASGTDLEGLASNYPGGVPRFEGESDDRYRRRVWLSANAITPFGNAELYIFWALTSDNTLRDATAIAKPKQTGRIIITVLSENTLQPHPSDAVLDKVRLYVRSEARQGLTDIVKVQGPSVTQVTYRIRYWLFPGPDQQTIETSMRVSLEKLIERQRRLGFDHTIMGITGACALSGVQNVVVDEPAHDVINDETMFTQVIGIELSFQGRAE